MKGLILSRTELLFLPELSLILFMLVFVAAVVWIFRPGAKEIYRQRSGMPLDEGRPVEATEVRNG